MMARSTVALIYFCGTALLLWLVYRWLGLDESDGFHLIGSFALAAAIILGFAWLNGFALAKFSGLSLRRAAGRGLITILPFALLSILALAIYGTLAWVQSKYSQPAFVVASFLTLHLRKPIPPSAIRTVFHLILLLLEWCIVPALLLRLAANIAAAGRISLRTHAGRVRSSILFAMVVAALLVCAIWIPLKLFFWIPEIASFNGQFASLIVRVCAGYLLFVACILFLEFVTVAGTPAETQASTVSWP